MRQALATSEACPEDNRIPAKYMVTGPADLTSPEDARDAAVSTVSTSRSRSGVTPRRCAARRAQAVRSADFGVVW